MGKTGNPPEGVVSGQDKQGYRPQSIAWITKAVAAGTSLFCLSYVSGALPALNVYFYTIEYNAYFMAGILLLGLMLYPAKAGAKRSHLYWFDVLLVLAVLTGTIYVIVNVDSIEQLGRLLASPTETVLGIITVIALLEVVRRTVGWPMILISLIFVAYARFGYLLPGILASFPQTWPRIIAEVYLTPSGIFGSLTNLASGIIISFIAFGAFFIKVGGGDVFLDLALSLTGHIRGGPAKAAIVGSAMFGTLSGSPAANVAVTGPITIPLMKRTGYTPVFAGAVETVASTGGLIMPPIMGAVAFVMASILEVAYVTVALAAIIPAVLFYIALFIQTDLRAAKNGLRGLPRNELPSFLVTLRRGWELFIPLMLLVLLLFVLRYPPAVGVSYTIGLLILISSFRKERRLNWRKFVDALEEAAVSMVMVAPIIAAASIIVSSVTMTGLGPKLASALVDLASGNNLFLFLLAAVACYIMGMGIAITVTYILLAILVAPALEMAGAPLIVAHFFILYMSLTTFITPPYAPAAFVASAISRAPPYRTGFQAMRLGIVTFIVPFILIYNPALILIGTPVEIALAVATAIVGVIALSIGIEGYLLYRLGWLTRILALGAGLAMLVPGLLSDAVGITLLALLVLWHCIRRRRERRIQAQVTSGET